MTFPVSVHIDITMILSLENSYLRQLLRTVVFQWPCLTSHHKLVCGTEGTESACAFLRGVTQEVVALGTYEDPIDSGLLVPS